MDFEFTYQCVKCHRQVSGSSRPDGCPECGGKLRNESFDRWREPV